MPQKVATASFRPPSSRTSQRFRIVLVCAALLGVGKWASSQYRYMRGGASNSVFEFVKTSTRGCPVQPYGSTLAEPWSTVRYLPLQCCVLSESVETAWDDE